MKKINSSGHLVHWSTITGSFETCKAWTNMCPYEDVSPDGESPNEILAEIEFESRARIVAAENSELRKKYGQKEWKRENGHSAPLSWEKTAADRQFIRSLEAEKMGAVDSAVVDERIAGFPQLWAAELVPSLRDFAHQSWTFGPFSQTFGDPSKSKVIVERFVSKGPDREFLRDQSPARFMMAEWAMDNLAWGEPFYIVRDRRSAGEETTVMTDKSGGVIAALYSRSELAWRQGDLIFSDGNTPLLSKDKLSKKW